MEHGPIAPCCGPKLSRLLWNAIHCCSAGVSGHDWSWIYWCGLDKSECSGVAWFYFLANLHYGSGTVQRLSWPLLMAVSSRELLAPNWSESVQKLASHMWAWLIFQLLRKWFNPGNNLHHQGLFTKDAFLSVIHRKPFKHILKTKMG